MTIFLMKRKGVRVNSTISPSGMDSESTWMAAKRLLKERASTLACIFSALSRSPDFNRIKRLAILTYIFLF